MLYRLMLLLFGYYVIQLENNSRNLTYIMKCELPFGRIRKVGDCIEFDILSVSKYSVLKKLSAGDIEVLTIRAHGLPFYLWSFRKRFGLISGFIIASTIVICSSLFVWDIRVYGNIRSDDSEILNSLEEYGVSVGAYIPDIEVKEICSQFLINSEDIAWMSINITGTKIEVNIKEKDLSNSNNIKVPSNIVATDSGLIERVEVFSGEALVKAGDSVQKGQVLVGGYYQSKNEGVYHFVESDAKIYARVTRSYTISIPLDYEESENADTKQSAVSIIFFGLSFDLPFTHDQGSEYTCEYLSIFGYTLPVGIKYTKEEQTKTVRKTLTPDEAHKVALDKIALVVNKDLADGELLSMEQIASVNEGYYVLTWNVYCIANIAQSIPIGITDIK